MEQQNQTERKRFNIRGGESESKIKNYLQELKKYNLSHTNYRDFGTKIKAAESVIDTQIEIHYANFDSEDEKFREIVNSDGFKNSAEKGLVSLDDFKILITLLKTLQKITGWQQYLIDIHQTSYAKLLDALGEVKAIDIERDVLARMSEDKKQQNEMVKGFITDKLKFFEEKHLHFTERMLDKMMLQMGTMNENSLNALKLIAASLPPEKVVEMEKIQQTVKAQKPKAIDPTDLFDEEPEDDVPDELPPVPKGAAEREPKPQDKKMIDEMEKKFALDSKDDEPDDSGELFDDETDDGSDGE